MNLHNELHDFYLLFSMLCYLAEKRKFKMIIENPFTQPHYLTTYFPIKPTIIDKDRTLRGDYYKKPTQYWFFNCKPQNNLIFEPLDYIPTQVIGKVKKTDGVSVKTLRSMIHPQYANRFIREFIIENS